MELKWIVKGDLEKSEISEKAEPDQQVARSQHEAEKLNRKFLNPPKLNFKLNQFKFKAC